jgi:hypothetical protein
MHVSSSVVGFDDLAARAALAGLPEAAGYRVLVKPLRYRTEPHLSAVTVFDDRTITLRVPQPFLPFGEIVPYGAKRMAGDEMRFVPLSEGITFHTPAEVVRFLYCHEWFHWYLYEIRGKGWSSETACDRFALRNYRRRTVTMDDAHAALRRLPRAPGPVRERAAKTPRSRRVTTPPLPGLEAFGTS